MDEPPMSLYDAIDSCQYDHTKPVPLETMLRMGSLNVHDEANVIFFYELTQRIGRPLLMRNLHYTKNGANTSPGRLIWIEGVSDLVLKGFHNFNQRSWSNQTDSICKALYELVLEMKALHLFPHRLKHILDLPEIIQSFVLLVFPLFEELFVMLRSPEYELISRGDYAHLSEKAVMSSRFIRAFQMMCQHYWTNSNAKIRIPRQFQSFNVPFPRQIMDDNDFKRLYITTFSKEPLPMRRVSNTPAGVAAPMVLPVRVPKLIQLQQQTPVNMKHQRLRIFIDQLSRRLGLPIVIRPEGNFRRFFIKGIPLCICAATAAVNGAEAEYAASDQIAHQLSKFGLVPSEILILMESDPRWIIPVLDAAKPLFQHFIDVLLEKFLELYDDKLIRVRQVELIESFSSVMEKIQDAFWRARIIIHQTDLIPPDIDEFGKYNFLTLDKSQQLEIFTNTRDLLAENEPLPYGELGIDFYVPPWDPINSRSWLRADALAALEAAEIRFFDMALPQRALNTEDQEKETELSESDATLIQGVKASAAKPCKIFNEALAEKLGTYMAELVEDGDPKIVKVKLNDFHYALLGGCGTSASEEFATVFAHQDFALNLAKIGVVPDELVQLILLDQAYVGPLVTAILEMFNFIRYILDTNICDALKLLSQPDVATFASVDLFENTGIPAALAKFKLTLSNYSANYWRTVKIDLPLGHKDIGRVFECGAVVSEQPNPGAVFKMHKETKDHGGSFRRDENERLLKLERENVKRSQELQDGRRNRIEQSKTELYPSERHLSREVETRRSVRSRSRSHSRSQHHHRSRSPREQSLRHSPVRYPNRHYPEYNSREQHYARRYSSASSQNNFSSNVHSSRYPSSSNRYRHGY